MPEFRVCRYVMIEQFDIVEAESKEAVQAMIDADKGIDMTLSDDTAEYGPIAIFQEELMVVGPDPIPLESVSKLAEQNRILRKVLKLVAEECRNTPKREDDPHLSHNYDQGLIAETVLAVRAALEATKEKA